MVLVQHSYTSTLSVRILKFRKIRRGPVDDRQISRSSVQRVDPTGRKKNKIDLWVI